jgi:hypothetical protein
MSKLAILLDEVNKELETAETLNPQMAMGMNTVKDMILKLQAEGSENAVITLTVDDAVPDLLNTFGQSLNAMLRDYINGAMDLDNRRAKPRSIPAEFMRLISPDALTATMDNLDLAINAEAAVTLRKQAMAIRVTCLSRRHSWKHRLS